MHGGCLGWGKEREHDRTDISRGDEHDMTDQSVVLASPPAEGAPAAAGSDAPAPGKVGAALSDCEGMVGGGAVGAGAELAAVESSTPGCPGENS